MFQFHGERSKPSAEQNTYGMRPGSRFTLGYLDEHERAFAAVVIEEFGLVKYQLENKEGEAIAPVITSRSELFRAAIICALPPLTHEEQERRRYDDYAKREEA